MSVLYVRVSPKLKESIIELAKNKEMLLADYVREVLINHIEMNEFVKSQQVINPALMEMWQFMMRPPPPKR